MNAVKSRVDMAQNPDVINSLRRLGLNQYEAKSYYALCTSGKSTAGDLAQIAVVARPRIYDVLRSLQDKGFVAVQQGRPVKYASLPLGEAIKTLKKKRHESLAQEITKIEEIGGSLASKMVAASTQEPLSTEERVWTLKGRDAIYSKLGSMIDGAKRHVTISSTSSGVMRKFGEHAKLFEKAKGRGVKIHVVSQLEKQKAAEISKLAKVSVASLPTRFALADDQALIFLSEEGTEPEEETGVWLKAPHLVETLKRTIGE